MPEPKNFYVSLVIPIFNEYEGIPYLVENLNSFFGENPHLRPEVIFVNDGSKDRSVERLLEMNHATYKAKVISLSRNFGSHAALRAGISVASGEYVCFNYADLQDPLELIIRLEEKAREGNEIIWAHRESTKVSLGEKTFSSLYAFLMKKYAFSNFPEKGFDIVM
ncbi:MAG TPA: glycosyltransferase, partial [Puia sp.]|nr:glycosyltransferase [Puia sp.]